MDSSKLFSIMFTSLVVIIAYYVYVPYVELPNLVVMKKNIKDLFDFNIFHNPQKEELGTYFETLNPDRLFTVTELSKFTGTDNGPIYLSILGKVFDVTKGREHYGIGKSYHGFAGRDGSKAFITGDFTEDGLVDNIIDLSVKELGDLQEWVKKYENDYVYKGKLIGRFYDKTGKPTEFLRNLELLSPLKQKKINDFYMKNYPPCNAEWTPETGSRVWCSHLSGGIKRDWIGFPRKFHQPGSGVSRCACVNIKVLEPTEGNLELYENCDPLAVSCSLM